MSGRKRKPHGGSAESGLVSGVGAVLNVVGNVVSHSNGGEEN